MSSWKTILKYSLLGIPPSVSFIDVIGYVARVDGKSMQPSLNPDSITDYVFLSSWKIRHSQIRRGDIVSFVSPRNPKHNIIKRVIGIEGDVILSKSGSIVYVPRHHVWVEGDHAAHSLDSNKFGSVSTALITSKATAIVWPPSRWQWLKSEQHYDRLPLNLLSIFH